MVKLKTCLYNDCWYNHNFKNVCTADDITLDFTGTCEKLMHCDEFECDSCEKFEICDKHKKSLFKKKNQ